jgi:hypothetical protein
VLHLAAYPVERSWADLLWGISRNTRRWLSLAEGEEIGYHPGDDSEAYADSLPPGDLMPRIGSAASSASTLLASLSSRWRL